MQGVYCSPRSWLFAMNVLPRPIASRSKMLASCKTLATAEKVLRSAEVAARKAVPAYAVRGRYVDRVGAPPPLQIRATGQTNNHKAKLELGAAFI